MTDIKNPDRRIERTKLALRTSLLELVRTKNWADISVRMICQNGDVARSSFYLHFENKTELLDHLFDEGLSDVRQAIETDFVANGQYACIAWLVDHVDENNTFFNNGQVLNEVIFSRFRGSFSQLLIRERQLRGEGTSPDELVFVVGGVFALLLGWTAGNRKEPVVAVKIRLNQLTSKVLG